MAKYFLFESSDYFTQRDTETHWQLASDLKEAGNEVILFLVGNGVLPARKSVATPSLTKLAKSGVQIWADPLALRERGITHDTLLPDVQMTDMHEAINCIAQGYKAIWH